MQAHYFLGIQKHHSPGACGQRYENQLQDLLEGPKEVETMNQLHLWAKKADAFQHDNTRSHTNVATTAQ
jgi:hypothetical protein